MNLIITVRPLALINANRFLNHLLFDCHVRKNHDQRPDGRRVKNYDVNAPIEIAAGLLIAASHNAGFVSLTHMASPIGPLSGILDNLRSSTFPDFGRLSSLCANKSLPPNRFLTF